MKNTAVWEVFLFTAQKSVKQIAACQSTSFLIFVREIPGKVPSTLYAILDFRGQGGEDVLGLPP